MPYLEPIQVIIHSTKKKRLPVGAENLPGTLLLETRELLTGQDLYQIALHTGLPQPWLRTLALGQIVNPSVNRVQKLYEHLSGRKLIC